MEDKEFMRYFRELSETKPGEQKYDATSNIINSLLGIENIRKSQSAIGRKFSDPPEHSVKTKYINKKYGSDISVDLNYTLSRLIQGLISENITAKEGFFLCLTSVLQRFKQISIPDFLREIEEKALMPKFCGNHERKHIIYGRILIFRCMLESQAVSALSNEVFSSSITHILGEILNIYSKEDWTRMLIGEMIERILNLTREQKEVHKLVMEKIYKMIFPDHKIDDIYHCISHPDKLLLFLVWKNYSKSLKQKKSAKIENISIIHEKYFDSIKDLFFQCSKMLPRKPLVFKYLIEELANSPNFHKNLSTLWNRILEKIIFASEKKELKGVSNLNYLNIGLCFVLEIFNNKNISIDEISIIFTPNFMKIFVRNLQKKEKLYAIAEECERKLVEKLEELFKSPKIKKEEKSEAAILICCKLFGSSKQVN